MLHLLHSAHYLLYLLYSIFYTYCILYVLHMVYCACCIPCSLCPNLLCIVYRAYCILLTVLTVFSTCYILYIVTCLYCTALGFPQRKVCKTSSDWQVIWDNLSHIYREPRSPERISRGILHAFLHITLPRLIIHSRLQICEQQKEVRTWTSACVGNNPKLTLQTAERNQCWHDCDQMSNQMTDTN